MLPDYTIRESPRAKHVRFRITLSEGLIVVIPVGFNRKRIPALLEEKRAWLTQSLKEIETRRKAMPLPETRPQEIELRCIGQTWRLDWVETDMANISIQETDAFQLEISGAIQDYTAWQQTLKHWLMYHARAALIPWANALSQELGIPIQRVVIRCQKTRWGSYSSKGTVSLNAQLLLLPRPVVSYVLVHELCHAMHLNHSAQFWRLVRQWEPDADRLRAELRKAGRFIPSWIPE